VYKPLTRKGQLNIGVSGGNCKLQGSTQLTQHSAREFGLCRMSCFEVSVSQTLPVARLRSILVRTALSHSC